jgi:hypothetical protein
MRVRLCAVAAAFTLHGARAFAQSAQPLAIQGSVLATSIYFNQQSVGGVGVEAQLRANRLSTSAHGAFSAGLGGQYTSHSSGSDNIKLTGVFVEPRYAFVLQNAATLFPYIALRGALLRQSSNFASSSSGYAFGGGGGVVYHVSRVVNFDLGGAVIRQSFGDVNFTTGALQGTTGHFKPFTGYAVKAGLALGFGSTGG